MDQVITGHRPIVDYRAKVILMGLKLEILGMKRKGPSCYKLAKAEYGLKGSKKKVYKVLKEVLNGGV